MSRTPPLMQATLDLLEVEHVRDNLWRCPRCEHRGLKATSEVFFCHASCGEGGGPVKLAMWVWGLDREHAEDRLYVELGLDPKGKSSPLALLKKIDDLENKPEEEADWKPSALWAVECARTEVGIMVRKAMAGRKGMRFDPDGLFLALHEAIEGGEVLGLVDASKRAATLLLWVKDVLMQAGLPVPEVVAEIRPKWLTKALGRMAKDRHEALEKALGRAKKEPSLGKCLDFCSRWDRKNMNLYMRAKHGLH